MSNDVFKVSATGSEPSYEAATKGRRARGWYSKPTGPNHELIKNLSILRNRSINSYRNSGFIANGIEKLVSNEIGTGIKPHPLIADDEIREQVVELWDCFAEEADADGVTDVYGLQEMAARACRLSGEGFLRRRIRRLSDGLCVPLQVQALEADFCPHEYTNIASNGNRIRAGKEVNSIGKVVAYHFYRAHPSEFDASLVSRADFVRIPAENIIHHFKPWRPGQMRGEPSTTQSMLKTRTLEMYEDSELERKGNRAGFTGAIYREDTATDEDWLYDPYTGNKLAEDADTPVDIQSGTMLQLLTGEKVQMFESDKGDSTYEPFTRGQRLAVAAGLDGLPYEILSGDYADVNDRIVRAILNQFQRQVEMRQAHWIIPQVCKGMYSWFMDMSVATGKLNIPDYLENRRQYQKCLWVPQAWKYLHPEQDVNALIKAIENDLDSTEDVVRSRNKRLEDILTASARYKKLKSSMGLDQEADPENEQNEQESEND